MGDTPTGRHTHSPKETNNIIVSLLSSSNLSIPLSDFDNKQNGEAITAKVIENLQSMNFIGLTVSIIWYYYFVPHPSKQGPVTFNA